MKKFRFILASIIILITPGLYAQIVNLTNMSAEWERTGNRNAAIDAADIVFYNPAGLTKLADGIHLNISNQTLIRQPEHTADYSSVGGPEKTYSHDGVDWFLPNFYLAYKQGNWAAFTGIFIPAGGATVNYPDGSVTTEVLGGVLTNNIIYSQSVKASSIYLAGILGGSYAINEMFSLAAGLRYVNATNKTKLELDGDVTGPVIIKTEDTADGFSGVIGVNITPLSELNIGMRYETITKMEFETDVKEDSTAGAVVTDGEKNRNDIPAVFAIGALYTLMPELALEADLSYYFQKQADWGKDSTTGIDYAENAGDCYTVGLAALYKVNAAINASAGFTYTRFMWEDENAYYTKMGSFETLFSDNIAFLIGGAYEVYNGIKLNLAYNYTWWKSETLSYYGFPVKTKSRAHVITFGADCTF